MKPVPPRQHLVPSAKIWYDAARKPDATKAESIWLLENAYNHVENALHYARKQRGQLLEGLKRAMAPGVRSMSNGQHEADAAALIRKIEEEIAELES